MISAELLFGRELQYEERTISILKSVADPQCAEDLASIYPIVYSLTTRKNVRFVIGEMKKSYR